MSFFYGAHHQQHHQQQQHAHAVAQSQTHHGGRSRRAPRLSASQNSHRQFRGTKGMKDVNAEAPSITAFRVRFEAGRSFDLDDDLEFCPNLLTLDERQSVHSGSSDRSSLSSGSPDSSPLQHQVQPQQQVTPSLSLTSAATPYISTPTFTNTHNNMKIHQPSAVRTRNAIPIVNPSTGMRVASPPSSISPGMMQQTTAARRW